MAMKWSWKIGEFAGIGVYMHATFLLLLGWVAFTGWSQTRTLMGALGSVAFILALFLVVVLHEYGHALTARRFGIKTRDITLLPIGGVARLERMPHDPRQELWVALAGPAVNVVIAAALFVVLLVTGALEPITQMGVTSGSFIERLMLVNVVLVLFNMIPAFPMDGGRVVRALLAMRLEYTRATQIAASLGQGIAFLLGFIGLFTNPLLVFTALFVWMGAAQESSMVQMKSSLGGIPVSRAMLTDFRTVTPHDALAHVIELILSGSQQDFPVVEGGRAVGVLTRGDLLSALQRHGPAALVGDVMRKDIQVADSFEMLETVSARLQECGCHTMPVVHNGQVVGLVTMENIGEFLTIQSALGRPVKMLNQRWARI
jgi:Zn-dependent protease/CBS domain-containing protein